MPGGGQSGARSFVVRAGELASAEFIGITAATLVNTNLNAGEHSIDFSVGQFSSGLYLYRLQTEYGALSQKMIIMK